MQRGRAIGRCAGVGRGVDDLVPAPVERSPTIGAGRSEEDDAWRPRRGGDVRDAGVVRDQQIEGRDDRGELAEIGHAGEIERGLRVIMRRTDAVSDRSCSDPVRTIRAWRCSASLSPSLANESAGQRRLGSDAPTWSPITGRSIRRTDQRCRPGPFGRCHRKFEVQTSRRRANRLRQPQPPQWLRLALDPVQRRRQPPFAGGTEADGVRRLECRDEPVAHLTRPMHLDGKIEPWPLRDRPPGAGG